MKKRWIDEDHIFTSPNITVYELLLTVEVKHTISRPCNKKYRPRKMRNGKVKIITIKEEK